MQRYLIIGAVAVVALGIAAAAYFLFFSPAPSVVVAPAGDTFGEESAGTSTGGLGGGGAGAPAGDAGASSSPPVVIPSGAQEVAARLLEVDPGPVVAGALALDIVSTTTGTTTHDVAIDYLSRQSGNIFSYHFNTHSLIRTSNRTVPGIQSAQWLASGATAYVQYLSGDDNATVNTYALPASGAGGFFLPQDIGELAVGASSLLYLASGDNGTIATVEKPDGSAPAQAFTTPLSQVRAQFAGKGRYLVYTKPSASIPGYAFLVSGGAFSEVAGPLNGLVALASPEGDYALISYASAGVLKMELVDLATRAALPLPVATIADKCAWAVDESAVYCGVPIDPAADYAYPDDWYQGAVHFSDRIWKIDVAGRYAELVTDLSTTASEPIDATDLALDPKSLVLVFRNKTDSSLWAYQL
ncbi:MAG TPA: hypothetical protein VHC68_03450 [Candidatus Paceibacterota bacterium]|nr:hypothetical protein [Candidatus Paceibacterota bacterium]